MSHAIQEIGFGNWNVVRREREEMSQSFKDKVRLTSKITGSYCADLDRMVD
jgi:hypothetical protein